MARRKITDAEVEQALTDLPGWQVKEGRLHKVFKFSSFGEAMGWMVSVAVYADKIDHHPDWSNSYNRVTVDLMTHDMDALSTLDISLARKMEEMAN
jgi:4a-hydroxytetrahydrobiopterin dehydratase